MLRMFVFFDRVGGGRWCWNLTRGRQWYYPGDRFLSSPSEAAEAGRRHVRGMTRR